MKSISAELDNHLQRQTTTVATCWEITRSDGQVFRFTDHNADIQVDGNTFFADVGYNRSAVVNDSTMGVDNLEVQGIVDSDLLKEDELRAGLFDHAEIKIFLVNYKDLSQGILRIRRGWLGEVIYSNRGTFQTELRGMSQALSQRIGEVYSATCRADLGDSKCGVDILDASWYKDATIVTVTDRRTFTINVTEPRAVDDWFNLGAAVFQTGNNAGIAIEIKDWVQSTSELTLFLPTPYVPESGDTLKLFPGCDKRLETCRTKFDNAINFRGEPFVPGQDEAMRYPNAK